jgi:hypothetical protein
VNVAELKAGLMKKWLALFMCVAISGSTVVFAKLNSQQTGKCIYSDKTTESAFQDLQAAYGLRLIEAKDFFQSMDKAKNCAELKKNLQKLRRDTVALMPAKPAPLQNAQTGSGGSSTSGPSSFSNSASGSGTTGGTFGAGTHSAVNDGSIPPNGFGAPPPPPSYGVPPPPPAYPGEDFYPPTDSYGFPADEMDY